MRKILMLGSSLILAACVSGCATTAQPDPVMTTLCKNPNDARAAANAAIAAAQFIVDPQARAATLAAANLTLGLLNNCPPV